MMSDENIPSCHHSEVLSNVLAELAEQVPEVGHANNVSIHNCLHPVFEEQSVAGGGAVEETAGTKRKLTRRDQRATTRQKQKKMTSSLFSTWDAANAPAANEPLFVSWDTYASTRAAPAASKELWAPEATKYYLVVEGEHMEECCRELAEPFGADMLKSVLKCDYFQAVPCTEGALGVAGAVLWMDEEARMNMNNKNEVATRLFGEQVFGGELYGEIILSGREVN
jgi:hypothetical protein